MSADTNRPYPVKPTEVMRAFLRHPIMFGRMTAVSVWTLAVVMVRPSHARGALRRMEAEVERLALLHPPAAP